MSQRYVSFSVILRSKTLKKPKTFFNKRKRVFQVLDLREILQMFNGEECYVGDCEILVMVGAQ